MGPLLSIHIGAWWPKKALFSSNCITKPSYQPYVVAL
jgi:hypothetical protein